MNRPLAAFAAALALGAPAHAETADAEYALTLPVEFQFDVIEGDAGEGSDGYITFEPDLTVMLAEGFRFNAGLTLEPVADWDDEKRFLEDHGLFVRELNVEFDVGPATVKAGKLTPTFAFAYDELPGIYGDLLTDELELAERMGGEATLSFGGEDGTYSISAAVFTADTTFLSDSILEGRGRTEEDGSIGNTGELENFTVALTADGAFGVDGLFLRAAFLRQRGDDPALDEQTSWVVGGQMTFAAADDLEIAPLVEYVSTSFDGLDSFDQTNLTLGLTVRREAGSWSGPTSVRRTTSARSRPTSTSGRPRSATASTTASASRSDWPTARSATTCSASTPDSRRKAC